MRSILLATMAVALCGCVSSQPTHTATGQTGHVINCTPLVTSGIVGAVASASTSWGQCYQKAGELCGARGYTILQQVGENGVYGEAGRYASSVSTTNNRMMIIQCNGPVPAKK